MLKEKHLRKEKQLGKSLAYNNWYENIKRQAIKSLTCLYSCEQWLLTTLLNFLQFLPAHALVILAA